MHRTAQDTARRVTPRRTETPVPPRSVLGRGLAVLAAFGDTVGRSELSLAEVVQATGLPSATAHRLLAELVGWGAVERCARGRYRVGIRLWHLGALAPVARDLRDAALPPMQDLAAVTGDVVHLVVLDEQPEPTPRFRALFLERLAGHHDVRVRSSVGRRMPLHASGPGKVLLAHAPPRVRDAVLADGLPRLASGTITDPEALLRALAEVRATGSCLSHDEMTDGASSVAAPVHDPGGEVVASLAVVVPSTTALPPLVPAVRMAAAAASRRLLH